MVAIGEPARITYTNYRGETAERTITPKRAWYGISEWHPDPQWFLTAFDHDKNADRDFALIDFGHSRPSAARELALEEHLHAIEQQLAVNLGYFHDEKRFLLETLQAHITTRIAAIRVLSSPDHADAGKVEGDVEKWSIREIVAKAIAYHSVGDPHAKTIRGDQRWEWFVEEADKFISVFGYYLPAIPSAPASEGAE
jgi:predicted DNA-binding transcriptional regulator YafY